MHHTQFEEMLRDADIAYVIHPIIQKAGLSFAETRDALIALQVPRADGVARVVTSPRPHIGKTPSPLTT